MNNSPGMFRFTGWMTTWNVQIHGMDDNLECSDSPEWMTHPDEQLTWKVQIHGMDDILEWTTYLDE